MFSFEFDLSWFWGKAKKNKIGHIIFPYVGILISHYNSFGSEQKFLLHYKNYMIQRLNTKFESTRFLPQCFFSVLCSYADEQWDIDSLPFIFVPSHTSCNTRVHTRTHTHLRTHTYTQTHKERESKRERERERERERGQLDSLRTSLTEC